MKMDFKTWRNSTFLYVQISVRTDEIIKVNYFDLFGHRTQIEVSCNNTLRSRSPRSIFDIHWRHSEPSFVPYYPSDLSTDTKTHDSSTDIDTSCLSTNTGSSKNELDGDIKSIRDTPPIPPANPALFSVAQNEPSAVVCGRPTLRRRIVGGHESARGAWPWQASLRINGVFWCSGTLITSEWVMSAAHCMVDFGFHNPHFWSAWRVHLGVHNLDDMDGEVVTQTVSQIIAHPDYNGPDHFKTYKVYANDILLIKMSTPVTFRDYILPVCLPNSNSVFHNGTKSWVTGWGHIGEGGVALPPPKPLQEAQIHVIGNKQCTCLKGVPDVGKYDNATCAGDLNGRKDACRFDSGGPLVQQQNGRWIQSGIVSTGEGCARPNSPGVYTRVSRYQAWINSHISRDPPGFVLFTSTGVDADSNFTCR
ncbi:prostasin-like [Engraulis encrasicolus]|uniref:prostasin-like n=1 Tax=Engraulis encrasicolus TaxID=184585 RepID=UPI002FD4F5B2